MVVLRQLRKELGSRAKTLAFLKVPVVPRVKEKSSLVAKALYRGKNYDEPYEEITDRVGVRFVVLLLRDVDRLKRIVENHSAWTVSRDRDFEEERRLRPYEFNYQAVHYVVRPKHTVQLFGASVSPRIPCEVQLKTLLQHAYAELTHDLAYKPRTSVDPDVQHEAAKSMALTETADELFMSAQKKFESVGQSQARLYEDLTETFRQLIGTADAADERLNLFLLEELGGATKDVAGDDVSAFVSEEGLTGGVILQRQPADLLFHQPVVLLLMYLARHRQAQLREHWPLPHRLLEGVYATLGMSATDYS